MDNNTTTVGHRSWIERWDRQQEFYLPYREERYDAMLTALRHLVETKNIGQSLRVLDLGCGTGSIGQRLLAQFPVATYIGIDVDAALLELAGSLSEEYGNRFRVAKLDLALPQWSSSFEDGQFDVVTSSTALHWMNDEEIARIFCDVFRLLKPGGVFLNADNLAYASGYWQEIAASIGREQQSTAAEQGREDWETWWSAMRADSTLAPFVAERDLRFPPRQDTDAKTENPPPSLAGYMAALEQAGFTDIDVLWQRLDDRLLAARKPSSSSDPIGVEDHAQA